MPDSTTDLEFADNTALARGAAVLVLVGAIANGLGAVALPQASLAYKPGRLAEWLAVNLADPAGAEWGAILFTLGVLMMVPVAAALATLVAGRWRGLALVIHGAKLGHGNGGYCPSVSV